jgi:chaperone protein EcpD
MPFSSSAKSSCLFLLGALLCSVSTLSVASIVISGTRVIYPAAQKEVTIKLSNKGSGPVLIQSWVDNGDMSASPETIKTPFVLTPPINRLDPDKSQTLRLSYNGATLPTNKESIFWLNVLEIPAKKAGVKDKNFLNMAFRSRIKLFLRPDGLQGNANEAASALTWNTTTQGLRATNPTPFYVSLVHIGLAGNSQKAGVEGEMIAPMSSLDFKLSGAGTNRKINYSAVNDYGAITQHEATIK